MVSDVVDAGGSVFPLPWECSIYLAPSSVKGQSGFGVYTTRDVDVGESFLRNGVGDIPSIPVVDYSYEPKEFSTEEARERRKLFEYTFDNYWWGSGVPDHVNFEAKEVADFQATFGSLPNHHCLLVSLTEGYRDEDAYDDTMAPLGQSPGSGAFSYHMGRDFIATKPLPAGSEIFLNYGHCTKLNVHQEWAEYIPMPSDYEDAAEILLDYVASHRPLNQLNVEPIVLPSLVLDPETVEALLPRSLDELKLVLQGLDLSSSLANPQLVKEVMIRLAKFVGSVPRSVEWIRNNGMCLEHLVGRPSHLPHAGMGGFSQKLIQAGEVIVPVPLLQIVDRDSLTMYDDFGDVWMQQLLVNYCFGHPESSMLLCPLSNAGVINHCSERSRSCGQAGPNAKLRWASNWDPSTPIWLARDIDEIAESVGRGLSMEVVAIRDIVEGEEVFIDYGEEWETAWNDHVARWEPDDDLPAKGQSKVTSAKEANAALRISEEFIAKDIREDLRMTHDYLFTGCLYDPTEDDSNAHLYHKYSRGWQSMDDVSILSQFGRNASQFSFVQEELSYRNHPDRSHWPCTILFQYGGDDGHVPTYTVRIHEPLWHFRRDELLWSIHGHPRILTNYPRTYIHFFVQPYKSDQVQKDVFRHQLGLPADMWPEHWKNLAPSEPS